MPRSDEPADSRCDAAGPAASDGPSDEDEAASRRAQARAAIGALKAKIAKAKIVKYKPLLDLARLCHTAGFQGPWQVLYAAAIAGRTILTSACDPGARSVCFAFSLFDLTSFGPDVSRTLPLSRVFRACVF
jgi:hypothetical protein